MNKNPFFQKDIISADQFNPQNLNIIVGRAKQMKKIVEKKGSSQLLKGKIVTALFYEPSSRTFGSFIASIQRLGGGFLPLQGVTYSSVSKGETLIDTVRTFANFSDALVLRHPEVGSAKLAAEFCDKPVINAGDGVGEHPTQALLDFFTITDHFGQVSGLTITMVGDLLNGRTIHSLCKLLSLYKNVKLNLISPEILKLPATLKDMIRDSGVSIYESDKLSSVVKSTDVFYITRVQKERFTDLDIYNKLKTAYIITPEVIQPAKKSSIIMHPLPRVGEISLEVDSDPRAVYINEQMKNGMYVRMALLSLVLKK